MNDKNFTAESRRKKRRARRVAIGAVVASLVVVGMVTVVIQATNFTKSFFDDTQEKQDIEQDIHTLVMLEVLPFENIENADIKTIVAAGMWSVFFNEGKETLESDAVTGSYLIPALDIDRYLVKLFGPEMKIDHTSFTADDGTVFAFNDELESYLMPITSLIGGYYPTVVEIDNEKGIKTVTVGYIQNQESGMALGKKLEENVPSKYFDYIYEKTDDAYYITSIVLSDYKVEVPVTQETIKEVIDVAVTDPNKLVDEVIGKEEVSNIDSSLPTDESLDEQTEAVPEGEE